VTSDILKIDGLTPHQVLALSRVRGFKQYLNMLERYQSGICVFCDPLGPKNRVIREIAGWRMWENPFPSPGSAIHLVLASVRHISTETLPSAKDFVAIGELFEWTKLQYGKEQLIGGGVLMRFGSPEYNAGTVLHLHANIIIPNLESELRLPLVKDLESTSRGYKRLAVFEKLRMGVHLDNLSSEELLFLEEDLEELQKELKKRAL